jgi:aquaporin Z
MPHARIALAEGIGTLILILGGPGSAILATGGFFPDGSIGVLGVALAFGLSLMVAAYAVGPISGCHINPAVTVGVWLAGKVETARVPYYLVGQFVGAFVGGLLLVAITGTIDGFEVEPATFAVNGWDTLSPGGFGFGAMVVVEIIMTAVLVFNVLATTRRDYPPAAIGLHVGLTLTLIHLVSIPVDNTSVNPARSFAVAVFAGGDAVNQLWAFFVFPVVGALLGWAAHQVLTSQEEEDRGPARTTVPA